MPDKNDLTIIVMGLDKDGKPRAGAYPSSANATAAADAKKWGLRVCTGDDPASKMLAKDLPTGLAHNSAKVELPVIERETYQLLLKTVKCEAEPAPIKKEQKPAQPANPFDAIEVGSTVLAQVDKEEGYFPARVTKISGDGKTLTLQWKDYEKLPPFNMRKLAVGLIAKVQ